MIITLARTEQLGSNVVAFYFRPERKLRYMAGQFVELHLPHLPMDNRGDRRIFTLITAPHEAELGIAASFPSKGSSFKRALLALRPGDKLQIVGEPMGDFVLPKDASIPLIWMAGGVASASFVGMAKEITHTASDRKVTLFQSARQTEGLLFREFWAQAGVTLHQTVTGDEAAWPGRHSRFSSRDLLGAAQDKLDRAVFYISGSDPMVEALCRQLAAEGIAREQLVREAYTGY